MEEKIALLNEAKQNINEMISHISFVSEILNREKARVFSMLILIFTITNVFYLILRDTGIYLLCVYISLGYIITSLFLVLIESQYKKKMFVKVLIIYSKEIDKIISAIERYGLNENLEEDIEACISCSNILKEMYFN